MIALKTTTARRVNTAMPTVARRKAVKAIANRTSEGNTAQPMTDAAHERLAQLYWGHQVPGATEVTITVYRGTRDVRCIRVACTGTEGAPMTDAVFEEATRLYWSHREPGFGNVAFSVGGQDGRVAKFLRVWPCTTPPKECAV